jgi:translation initiation factor 1A
MYQSRIHNAKKRASRNDKNRTIDEPSDGQSFAIVDSMLGNGRLRALCADGKLRTGRIRGSMRKYGGKVIIEPRDLIIVAYRDFDEENVDVIHKYTHEEVQKVMKWYEIPQCIKKALQRDIMNDNDNGDEDKDDGIYFAEDDGLDVDGI